MSGLNLVLGRERPTGSGHDDILPAGQFIPLSRCPPFGGSLNARLLVAEEERELISKRTKQGLIKARQSGKRLGKPSQISRDVIDRIVTLRREGHGSKAIASVLTADGVPPPRADQWHFSTVRGVLVREGIER
jgi:hypothetical protein